MFTCVIAQTEEERNHVFRIRNEVFIQEQNIPQDLEWDEWEETAKHVLLYKDTIPVGAGRFRDVNSYCKVERICVLSDYRQHGVGNALMAFIEEQAKKLHFTKAKLNAQDQAVPFYLKRNYKITSEAFMDAGIPHYEMIKSL